MNEIITTPQLKTQSVRVLSSVGIVKNGKIRNSMHARIGIFDRKLLRHFKIKNYLTKLIYKIESKEKTESTTGNFQLRKSVIYGNNPGNFFELLLLIDRRFRRFVSFNKNYITYEQGKNDNFKNIKIITKPLEEKSLQENTIIIEYFEIEPAIIGFLQDFRNKMVEVKKSELKAVTEYYYSYVKLNMNFTDYDKQVFYLDDKFKELMDELMSWFKSSDVGYDNIERYADAKTKQLLSLDLDDWLSSLQKPNETR